MDFLISDAFAQAGGDAGGSLFSLLPLVVIFVLFYFLLIRPQQKRAKAQTVEVQRHLARRGGRQACKPAAQEQPRANEGAPGKSQRRCCRRWHAHDALIIGGLGRWPALWNWKDGRARPEVCCM